MIGYIEIHIKPRPPKCISKLMSRVKGGSLPVGHAYMFPCVFRYVFCIVCHVIGVFMHFIWPDVFLFPKKKIGPMYFCFVKKIARCISVSDKKTISTPQLDRGAKFNNNLYQTMQFSLALYTEHSFLIILVLIDLVVIVLA